MKKIVTTILILLALLIFTNCTPEALSEDIITPNEQTLEEQGFGVGADPSG